VRSGRPSRLLYAGAAETRGGDFVRSACCKNFDGDWALTLLFQVPCCILIKASLELFREVSNHRQRRQQTEHLLAESQQSKATVKQNSTVLDLTCSEQSDLTPQRYGSSDVAHRPSGQVSLDGLLIKKTSMYCCNQLQLPDLAWVLSGNPPRCNIAPGY